MYDRTMRIAILGCGYVGEELGRQLAACGHEVVGVRRSTAGCDRIEELSVPGFEAVRADVTDEASLASVPDSDVIVFAASSGGRDASAARAVYVDGLQTTLDVFGNRDHVPSRLLYTSSTGVYGDHDGNWVDESTPIDPTTEKTAVLARAESIALDDASEYGIDGTVVRYAGLYGPDRYRLDRYLNGPVTEGYLNMVHRVDAAGAVRFLIEEDLGRSAVILVVDDEPVSKWEFADWLAEACDRESPPKRTKSQRLATSELSTASKRRLLTSKRCSNATLRSLGYEFTYPTFRSGYRDAIESYRDRTDT